ncbi:MAG: hypothetical protein P4M01_09910 [Acidobacteriota bacterium]|nr:hypothetical protein [Acidobacteriota bacterium]
MVNGGDPNSVAAQQQQSQPVLTPEAASADEKLIQGRKHAEQTRKVQALQLNRARICEQLERTSNERYKALLSSELEQIDGELAKLS